MPSLKNRKQIVRVKGRSFLVPSKSYKAWHKVAKEGLEDHPLIEHQWKSLPLFIDFHFVRATRHKFDFINVAQGPLDLLVEMNILPEDNMETVVPRKWSWEIDKENPRTVLTLIENDMDHS